jgi:dinuclear metal center YbgI/SA1388 family protein
MKDQEQPVTAARIKVCHVLEALNQIAPPDLAEAWDAIGLQVGDPDAAVEKVLLALDVTGAVLEEASAKSCQLVISHHPLIFEPLPAICLDQPLQKLAAGLIIRRLSLIAAHTNLDAAPGGVADCLLAALIPHPDRILPIGPFGRCADLREPQFLSSFLRLVKQRLGSSGCHLNTDQDRLVKRVAVFPGAFSGGCLDELFAAQPDLVVCGETKHHIGLLLAEKGIATASAGHDVTERVVLPALKANLARILPQIAFAVARDMDYNEIAF